MPPPYSKPVCDGSVLMRTECGVCEKCVEFKTKMGPALESIRVVYENQAKLRACKRHKFEDSDFKLGVKLVCKNCSGEMHIVDIGHYIKGYEAHGGSVEDIFPGFYVKKKT